SLSRKLRGALRAIRETRAELSLRGHLAVAAGNGEEAGPDPARRLEPLAGLEGTDLAEPADALDVRGVELGKDLIVPLLENRLEWLRHHGTRRCRPAVPGRPAAAPIDRERALVRARSRGSGRAAK